jgi:hypothetical protein
MFNSYQEKRDELVDNKEKNIKHIKKDKEDKSTTIYDSF